MDSTINILLLLTRDTGCYYRFDYYEHTIKITFLLFVILHSVLFRIYSSSFSSFVRLRKSKITKILDSARKIQKEKSPIKRQNQQLKHINE